jgi:hypothetical protein
MKGMTVPFMVWVGVLPQLPQIAPAQPTLGGFAALLAAAATLAGLTTSVYRLGMWRQEMHNTKHDVGAEIARYREETRRDFARLHERLGSVDRHVAQASELRVDTERWRARTDTTVRAHEQRIERVESVVARVAQERGS